MDKILLGQRIRQARILRDCTLNELAYQIGVNKSTISRYERGEIDTPKLPVIEAISNCLHVNPSWLIGKSDLMSYTPKHSNFAIYSPCGKLFRPLKTLREERGIAVDDMAFRIGISAEDYLKIEAGGDTYCSILAKIAVCLDCDVDHILSFDGVFGGKSRPQEKTAEQSLIHKYRQLNAKGRIAIEAYLDHLLSLSLVSNGDEDSQDLHLGASPLSLVLREKDTPTPIAEDGRNVLKIAGRDGRLEEHHLTDEQLAALDIVIDQLPPADL